jgi:hypothetical protein
METLWLPRTNTAGNRLPQVKLLESSGAKKNMKDHESVFQIQEILGFSSFKASEPKVDQ